jgi:predicted peptidase
MEETGDALMKIRFLAIVVLTFLGFARSAEYALAATDKDGFETRTYQSAGENALAYLLLRPADYQPKSGKKYPLLVFLHGAGERGVDNRAQLRHGKDFLLAAAKQHECFVVAPQCPTKARWVEVDWTTKSHLMPEKPSVPMGLLLELLPKIRGEFVIDPDRIYVMGLSMGGYGTWDILHRCPDVFAAAVPICGGADVTKAEPIARLPVWAFHGAKDTLVPTSRSRDMIEAMRKAGGSPRYTELPGVGHDAWVAAFANADLPNWLFAQRREKKSPTTGSREADAK